MQRNLHDARDFPMAERLATALAAKLGRQSAQQEVQSAVRTAAKSGRRLGEYLRAEPAGQALLSRAGIDEPALTSLLDPNGYLGSAELFIERALAAHDKLEREMKREMEREP